MLLPYSKAKFEVAVSWAEDLAVTVISGCRKSWSKAVIIFVNALTCSMTRVVAAAVSLTWVETVANWTLDNAHNVCKDTNL